jgi:hypothetical protein
MGGRGCREKRHLRRHARPVRRKKHQKQRRRDSFNCVGRANVVCNCGHVGAWQPTRQTAGVPRFVRNAAVTLALACFAALLTYRAGSDPTQTLIAAIVVFGTVAVSFTILERPGPNRWLRAQADRVPVRIRSPIIVQRRHVPSSEGEVSEFPTGVPTPVAASNSPYYLQPRYDGDFVWLRLQYTGPGAVVFVARVKQVGGVRFAPARSWALPWDNDAGVRSVKIGDLPEIRLGRVDRSGPVPLFHWWGSGAATYPVEPVEVGGGRIYHWALIDLACGPATETWFLMIYFEKGGTVTVDVTPARS